MNPVHFRKPMYLPLRYSVEVQIWLWTRIRPDIKVLVREELG